jgi:hypothetical protein
VETIRENLVKTTRGRVSGTNFGEGECAAKRNYATEDPGAKKHPGITRFKGNIARGAKYAHAYYQTYHDHSEVKAIKFWGNAHFYLIVGFLNLYSNFISKFGR